MAKRNLQRYASTLFEWLYVQPNFAATQFNGQLTVFVGLGSPDIAVPLRCGELYTRLVGAGQHEPFLIFTGSSRVSATGINVSQASFYMTVLQRHCAVPSERVRLETHADSLLDMGIKTIPIADSLGVAENLPPYLVVVPRSYLARRTGLVWGKYVDGRMPLLVLPPVTTFEKESEKMDFLGGNFGQILANEVLLLARLVARQQVSPVKIPKEVMSAAELLR